LICATPELCNWDKRRNFMHFTHSRLFKRKWQILRWSCRCADHSTHTSDDLVVDNCMFISFPWNKQFSFPRPSQSLASVQFRLRKETISDLDYSLQDFCGFRDCGWKSLPLSISLFCQPLQRERERDKEEDWKVEINPMNEE
jgi:hypothetical protein